jgi:hypothetical protein
LTFGEIPLQKAVCVSLLWLVGWLLGVFIFDMKLIVV